MFETTTSSYVSRKRYYGIRLLDTDKPSTAEYTRIPDTLPRQIIYTLKKRMTYIKIIETGCAISHNYEYVQILTCV